MPDHTDELTAMAQEDGMYDVDETTPFRCYPDAEPEIKPRVTQAGDELCDYVETCPQRARTSDGCDYCSHEETYCKLLDEWVVDETICPVAARRTARELADAIGQTDLYKERIQQLYASHARKDVELARLRVEVEAWRSGRLYMGVDGAGEFSRVWFNHQSYATIDAAVDALIAEDARNQTEMQENGEQEHGRR